MDSMDRLAKVLVEPTLDIRGALKTMDESGERILIVTDENRTLQGVVTDGDLRRWILKSRGLEEPVTQVMNPDPVVLKAGHSAEEARELMLASRKECLPVIDEYRHVLSAVWWMDLFETRVAEHNRVDLPVVIMAGGEGTRLSPFTKVLPKPLMPIGETPIIELIIERFVQYGCGDFYLSVNYKAALIKAYFNDLGHDYSVSYIEETEPLGTVGSLRLLKGTVDGPFFLSNCDVLVEADYGEVYRFHAEHGNHITLVGSMKQYTIPYGVCEIGDEGDLVGIREKPEYNFLVSTGLAVLEPGVLDEIPDGQVCHMTDLVNASVAAGRRVGVYPVSEKAWLDMGQFEELQETLKRFEGR